jgi:hypothetical protein
VSFIHAHQIGKDTGRHGNTAVTTCPPATLCASWVVRPATATSMVREHARTIDRDA